jgi:lipoprotein-anchoring transpeptidase ErfK/SrfK
MGKVDPGRTGHRTRRRRWLRQLPAVALVPVLLLTAACTTSTTARAGSDGSAAAATPTPTASEAVVVMDPADGAVDIAPEATITVRAEQGTLEKVVLSGGAPVPGQLSPDRTTWTATGLFAGTRYVLSARAEDRHGLSTLKTTSFTTLAPTATAKVKMAPVQDETVGVGMPIMLTLTQPTADRAAVERRLTVESTPPVTGSWYWLSDSSLHYRPQTYWPANTTVTVRMSLRGVPFGNGVYGEHDRIVSFRTGDAMISRVDVAGHHMTVTQNGQHLRTIPVTTGKPGQATRAGIKIISEKYVDKRMDAATTGVDSTDPDYYVVDVKYAMRVTNTGEFLHAAPWSVGSQGSDNVSHGCTGMSTEDAGWLFDISRRGDVVEYVNSDRPLEPGNGITDWNVPWEQWLQGSAL